MQSISITPRGSGPTVTLTDAAAAKVAELMAREGEMGLVLRLGVRPGGCSGFSYEMFFDSRIDDSDHVSERAGVRLAVDDQSMEMLAGAGSTIGIRCREPGSTSPTPIRTAPAAAARASRRRAGVADSIFLPFKGSRPVPQGPADRVVAPCGRVYRMFGG